MHAKTQANRTGRRGFTLLEALMGISILLVIVLAVTSAVSAGQQHALEAQLRIAGTLSADELMSRISIVPYEDLASWDGYTEADGSMVDAAGNPYPGAYARIGRRVDVSTRLERIDDAGVNVRGRLVSVRAVSGPRTLVDLQRFFPEPGS